MEDLEFFELKKIDTEKIREYVLNALDSESITDKSLFNRMFSSISISNLSAIIEAKFLCASLGKLSS